MCQVTNHKLRCSPSSGAPQDPDFIQQEQLWITKAATRTYIQGIFGTPKKKRLIVEVSELMSKQHREVVETLAEHIKTHKVTKEQVKALREKLVS
jgi:hypothetical protein